MPIAPRAADVPPPALTAYSRSVRYFVLCVLAFAPALQAQSAPAASTPSPEQLRSLMRKVLSNLTTADRNLSDYAYARYSVRRQFDGDGDLEEEHTILARREFLDGYGFTQQIRHDGQPVPADQIQREQAAFRQHVAELEAMTEAERQAADEDNRKSAAERNQWLKEFPEALAYKQVGEEMVNGRATLVLECSPRPGYKAANLRARVFEKVRGKLWIDKAESQLVRVDAEVFETVNIGWGVVGRIQKGTRFHLERGKLADGSWLPSSQSVRFTARVLLFKTISQEETTRYSEFRHKSTLTAAE